MLLGKTSLRACAIPVTEKIQFVSVWSTLPLSRRICHLLGQARVMSRICAKPNGTCVTY